MKASSVFSQLDRRLGRRLLGWLVLGLWLALSVACSELVVSETRYPLVLVDNTGVEVRIDAAPERIVSMMPSHTEGLCALGDDICDLIIGVDDFSNFPAQINTLPRLGSGLTPNLEAIVALEPDLVLTDEAAGAASERMRDLGLTVYAGTAATYPELFENLRILGRIVNRNSEALALNNRIRRDVDAISQQVAGEVSPRVYYEVFPDPLFSASTSSFIGALIARAGGDNIVPGDLGTFPQLDPEFVVAADPEVIILASLQSIDDLRARPGWENISAVRNGRVVSLTEVEIDELSRPAPRIVDGLRRLAEIIHPQLAPF